MPLLANRLTHRGALILACLAALIPAALCGQEAVGPGARVRILAPATADTLITGTVAAIDSASLLLAADFDTAGAHVPLAHIRRLEVAQDPAHGRRRAGLWGLLLGGAAGYALMSSRCSDGWGCDDYRAAGVVGGAAVGMLLGGLFGRGSGGDSWRTVPVPGHGAP
ncbi:MAG: hypothetical protein KY467_05865 [Gemmatimonadetes bacterium]|nr:hypothetical protein [Gemmatimonadota bacterium]